MVDAAHLTVVPDSLTVTQSRTSWGIELGRHRLSVTRSHEARTLGRTGNSPRRRASPKPAWPLAVGAFASISAFGLFVFGAMASEPLISRQHVRYLVSLPVPARTAKSVKQASARKVRTVPTAGSAPGWAASTLSGPRFNAADESYAVRAMRTGEFQEWSGSDGQRRFLSIGPEQAEGSQRCRDMALLVRGSDGSSRTQTARRCASATSTGRVASVGAEGSTWSDTAMTGQIGVPPLQIDVQQSANRAENIMAEAEDSVGVGK